MEQTKWTRTCQECGHKQTAKRPNPNKELTLSYLESKCKRCKSPSLDYGTFPSSLDEIDEEYIEFWDKGN